VNAPGRPERDGGPANPRIPVFLCGDAHRGDDGAALRVVRLLAPGGRRHADVIAAGQLDASMLLGVPEGTPCVIVDAVAGVEPGAIIAKPLTELAALGRRRAGGGKRPKSRSSHELPLEQALALADELRSHPVDGWFLGIGIADCALGETLSPAVAVALPALAARLAAILDELGHSEALSC
jgi:hydrogenase maturation protease